MLQRTALLISLLVAAANASGLKGVSKPTSIQSRQLKGRYRQGPKHRDCDIDSKKDEVQFECKSKTGGSKDSKDPDEPQDRGISIVPAAEIKDKIKYKVKTTKAGISVKLEYKNEIEMDDTETETKTKFELLFRELVEYVKAPEADAEEEAYDWDQDEIVQRFPLTEWSDIPGVMDDGVVAYFTVMSDSLSTGMAAFNFTISRADQGEQITANSMKIDVDIVDFPWSRSNSYVALLSTLESEKKVKVDYEKEAKVGKGKKAKDVSISFGEDMAETFGFTTYGEYTWAHEAEATGLVVVDDSGFNGTVMMARQGEPSDSVIMVDNTTETIEVVATSPEDSSEESIQWIAYSFVGPKAQGAAEIYWDPQAGVGYSGVGRTGVFMGLAATTVLALFSLLA